MAALSTNVQYVDPTVSLRKFNREVDEFRSHAEEYRKQGWFLVRAGFPNILVILATPKTMPPAIVCGVWFDYSNYDAAPPSVKLVNPFTCEPYRFNQLPTLLHRSLPTNADENLVHDGVQINIHEQQHLMVAHKEEDVPFLCIAGVREYHEHPAHSGDHWELYRTSGGGRLVRLLQIITKYGVEPIVGFQVQMVPKISLQFGVPPE